MRFYGSLWFLIGFFASLWVLMGSYRFYASLWVIVGLYRSLLLGCNDAEMGPANSLHASAYYSIMKDLILI